MQPKECVPDFESGIFDRTPDAMMGTSATEYCHMASWFEHSETLPPDICPEGDVSTVPFLVHKPLAQSVEWPLSPVLRRAGRIAHGLEVVWCIGDDGIND